VGLGTIGEAAAAAPVELGGRGFEGFAFPFGFALLLTLAGSAVAAAEAAAAIERGGRALTRRLLLDDGLGGGDGPKYLRGRPRGRGDGSIGTSSAASAESLVRFSASATARGERGCHIIPSSYH
jgi:hypothetical protein